MSRDFSTVPPALPTARIVAIASALPERLLTNEELAREYPEWDMARLTERTGVRERRVAAVDETALDLGYEACSALDRTGQLEREAIDILLFCTETPDYPIPPNACVLHGMLGLRPEVMAFDINLACSGFVYALGIVRGLLASGAAGRALIVTADTYSRLIHPSDRSSRVLFGDGGAATIVTTDQPRIPLDRDIASFSVRDMTFGTAGAQHERFIIRAGGSRMPRSNETGRATQDRSGNIRTSEHIEMDGLGVLSFFNSAVPRAVRGLLERNGLEVGDIGSFVFHQASRVAVEGVARALRLRPDQTVLDMSRIGNLVSASVPVALERAWEGGELAKDRPAVLCGFGVGLSWATALLDPA